MTIKKEYCYDAVEINTDKPGLVEYYNYRDRLIIKDRIKGLIHRYSAQKSNIKEKIQAAYGISNMAVRTDSTQDKRYDFEETDYPHNKTK